MRSIGKKLLIGTRNAGKYAEIKREIEANFSGLEIVSLDAYPGLQLVESGSTYQQNSISKATAALQATGLAAIADDSGLEVVALGGAPGPFSARFAGPGAKDSSNLDKLLNTLKGVPAEERGARFVCVMTLVTPAKKVYSGTGVVEGQILTEPRGKNGFGYDPVFMPKGFDKTFAEMDNRQKSQLSHRTRALHELFKDFAELFGVAKK